MYFTDERLSNDPELRPKIWKSASAFERERLFLLDCLANNLHTAANQPSPTPSSTSGISSSTTSLVSSTSDVVAVDSDKTSRSNSSIISSGRASSIASTPRSVSSFFSLPFGSTSRTSVASSGSSYVPHTPIVFNSPQTSTFSFETANPSPLKVDSVMGSPIRFRSTSIFKRKNKKTEKKDGENEGSTTGAIKEGSATDVSKEGNVTGSVNKEGRISSFFKTAVIKKHTKSATDDAKSTGTRNSDESDDTDTVKDFARIESESSLDSKGKEYVVERLGLGTVAEPQPIEHQYRFVKKQIEKAREKFLGQRLVKSGL